MSVPDRDQVEKELAALESISTPHGFVNTILALREWLGLEGVLVIRLDNPALMKVADHKGRLVGYQLPLDALSEGDQP